MATAPDRPTQTTPGAGHQLALSAISFMNDHMAEPLKVSDVAEHLRYSPFHFSRQFRSSTGASPGEFLTAVRFQRAKELLLDDDAPVVDICTSVGFTSLATFTRRFRQWVGVAPGALRTMAAAVSEHPTSPFSVGDPRGPRVEVTIKVPDHGILQPPLVWVGWYSRPFARGLPAAGFVRHGDGVVHLPLAPGFPWLLAFTVAREADVVEHLAPAAPVVAAHPEPITESCRVRLHCQPTTALSTPMLSALPALQRRG